jgi:hypothetical protein
MLLVRSLMLLGTLAIVATLWVTLLSGGDHGSAVTPGATAAPSGSTSTPSPGGYSSALDAAHGAVQQSNQDAGSAAGAP